MLGDMCDIIHATQTPLERLVKTMLSKYFSSTAPDPLVPGYLDNVHIVLALIKAAVDGLGGRPPYIVSFGRIRPSFASPQELLDAYQCPRVSMPTADESEYEESVEEEEEPVHDEAPSEHLDAHEALEVAGKRVRTEGEP